MKNLIIFVVLILSIASCTKKDKEIKPVEEAKVIEVVKKDVIILPEVNGLILEYEEPIKESDSYLVDGLRVSEHKTKRLIDDYPMFYWGSVKVKIVDSNSVFVEPVIGVLRIKYSHVNGEVVKSSSCKFSKTDDSKYDDYLKSAYSEDPQWDTIYYGIFNLASVGSKRAYDYFRNPKDPKLLEVNDGAASTGPIFSMLDFMEKSGCSWK